MEDRDQKLQAFIADCVEQVEAEEKERKALANANQFEYERLLADAATKALSMVKDLPSALLPYTSAAQSPGHWDHAGNIEKLKRSWLPERFVINAPGLVTISFSTAKIDSRYSVVTGISFNGLNGTTGNWTKAIAEAARKFQEHEERMQIHLREYERVQNDQVISPLNSRALTTAERLDNLIREIAIEAVEARMA